MVWRKWVGPPSDFWPSAPSCPCCSLGSLCLRKPLRAEKEKPWNIKTEDFSNLINLGSHSVHILQKCLRARERNITSTFWDRKTSHCCNIFWSWHRNSKSFRCKTARIHTKKMTGCNLEARLYSLKLFWPALVSRAQAHVHGSFASFILHHEKSLENQPTGQLIKSPLGNGGDGNGNLMKTIANSLVNIMGPHLRRGYHHRWPWWKRGRIRSGIPMPTWPGFGHGFTWILHVENQDLHILTKADVDGFNSKKSTFHFAASIKLFILISIIQSYKVHWIEKSLQVWRSSGNCVCPPFPSHQARPRPSPEREVTTDSLLSKSLGRIGCHHQGDIKVGPLAPQTTSPIDGIVVLARGRLPQRSQNWSVLQDENVKPTGPRCRLNKAGPLGKNGVHFAMNHKVMRAYYKSLYWVQFINLFPVYNII